MFLLYINDIIHSTNQGEFVIFADDTNIFIAAKDKAQAYKTANAVLRSVYIYMKTNQLHINLTAHIQKHAILPGSLRGNFFWEEKTGGKRGVTPKFRKIFLE